MSCEKRSPQNRFNLNGNGMGGVLSIVIANDHPLIRAGLSDMLAQDQRWKLVGFAKSGAEALKAIQRFEPDVAIIGSRISDPNAREIAAIVQTNFPHTALCLLANEADQNALFGTEQRRAELRGRVKIVIKERSPDRLSEWLDEIAVRSIGGLRNSGLPSIATPSRNRPDRQLTQRQGQIVTLLQIGLSNREISDRLGLSEGTVKVHLHRIFEKMGVSNRTQLAAQFMTAPLFRSEIF
jgi:two-component system, NarL family, nitrate/nitrite response regulator NarL